MTQPPHWVAGTNIGKQFRMPRRDSDALAVWDAKARTAIDRIDAVLEGNGYAAAGVPAVADLPVEADPETAELLRALAHRVANRAAPPPGEIVTPPVVHLAVDDLPRPAESDPRPSNMAHQPDRIDHWGAYVCRFDADPDDDAGSDRATA